MTFFYGRIGLLRTYTGVQWDFVFKYPSSDFNTQQIMQETKYLCLNNTWLRVIYITPGSEWRDVLLFLHFPDFTLVIYSTIFHSRMSLWQQIEPHLASCWASMAIQSSEVSLNSSVKSFHGFQLSSMAPGRDSMVPLSVSMSPRTTKASGRAFLLQKELIWAGENSKPAGWGGGGALWLQGASPVFQGECPWL